MMKNPMPRLESLKVADVMSRKLVTINKSQSMAEIASLFAKNEIASAPVVDGKGVCVGVLSAFDFLKREAASKAPSHAVDQRSQELSAGDAAELYMSTDVQSVRAETSILQVAHIMCTRHVHRLPVTDSAGKLIGIVSTMDLVAALLNAIDEASQNIGRFEQ